METWDASKERLQLSPALRDLRAVDNLVANVCMKHPQNYSLGPLQFLMDLWRAATPAHRRRLLECAERCELVRRESFGQ